jgi:hypothetical protein
MIRCEGCGGDFVRWTNRQRASASGGDKIEQSPLAQAARGKGSNDARGVALTPAALT